MKFKKLTIRDEKNKRYTHYEDSEGNIYNNITYNDLYPMIEKLTFNSTISLPDRMIQDFIYDGSLMPSFKKTNHFTNEDMKQIIEPLNVYKKKKKNIKKNTFRKKRKKLNKTYKLNNSKSNTSKPRKFKRKKRK